MKTLRTETSARGLVKELESDLPAIMERRSVPGLALSLVRAGERYWERAFGVQSRVTQEPVTLDTVFEAASLSKPVFAYAALQLCQEGVLDLDTSLDEYMAEPYLPDDPGLKLITMRHVLSHSTGFPNWRRKGQALRTHFRPGTRFSYSGEGYVYLQKVIEHVTGQPAAEFLKSQVLLPCDMRHSSFLWTGQESLAVAVGHDKAGEAQEKELWPKVNAAAGLHCTARDLARFTRVVVRPGGGSEFAQEMLSPQIQTNTPVSRHDDWPQAEIRINELVSWGLGWGLQKTTRGDSFWHWGDNGCYRAFALGFAREGHALVVMTNGENGQEVINWILRDALEGDYPGLDWLTSRY
jgi:CubicO group peptidase (beta-lactamase class C family)